MLQSNTRILQYLEILTILLLCFGVKIIDLDAQEIIPSLDVQNIRILNAVPSGLYEAKLSSQNNWIVVYASVFHRGISIDNMLGNPEYQLSHLQVWDTEQLINKSVNDSRFVNPIASISITIDDNWFERLNFAISPNDQWVAISTKNTVEVFTLPNLEHMHTISLTHWRSDLAWSLDGTLLLISDLGRVIVWDIVQNFSYEHSFDNDHQYRVHAFENGWLLDDRRNSNGVAFSFCSRLLDDCQIYRTVEQDNEFNIVPDLLGDTLLIPLGNIFSLTGAISIWERQVDGIYEQISTLPSTTPQICPDRYSPKDTYLFSVCQNTIWDVGNLAPVQTLTRSEFPTWFHNEEYFLTMDLPDYTSDMRLYQLGDDVPVSEFNFAEALNEDWDMLLTTNDTTLSLARLGTIHLNLTDDFAIVDLDWGVLFIPINK